MESWEAAGYQPGFVASRTENATQTRIWTNTHKTLMDSTKTACIYCCLCKNSEWTKAESRSSANDKMKIFALMFYFN